MSTTISRIAGAHSYVDYESRGFRASEPGTIRCNRCDAKFRSDDVRTNRRCKRCERDVIAESDRRAVFEGTTGRVLRKPIGK